MSGYNANNERSSIFSELRLSKSQSSKYDANDESDNNEIFSLNKSLMQIKNLPNKKFSYIDTFERRQYFNNHTRTLLPNDIKRDKFIKYIVITFYNSTKIYFFKLFFKKIKIRLKKFIFL